MKKYFLLPIAFFSFFSDSLPEDVIYDKIVREKFKIKAEQLASQCHIKHLSCQTGAMIDSQEVVWCAKYMIQYPLNIEEARPIVQGIFRNLLELGKNEPCFTEYIVATGKRFKIAKDRTLNARLFGLKIGFWDEEMNRPLYPNLAQIVVKENKIFYYYADPQTQALQEPPIIEDIPKEILSILP